MIWANLKLFYKDTIKSPKLSNQTKPSLVSVSAKPDAVKGLPVLFFIFQP